MPALGRVAVFCCFLPFFVSALSGAGLDPADRVTGRRAIEAVYWQHRVWPEVNQRAKPSLDEVLPKTLIERRADDSVAMSRALDALWQRPVTPDMLRREVERMATASRDPRMLSELFAALGNDSRFIAEVLARPLVAERLLRRYYAYDGRQHGTLEQRARRELSASTRLSSAIGDRFSEVEWRRSDKQPRADRALLLTDSEFASLLTTLEQKLNGHPLSAGRVSDLLEDYERFYAITIIHSTPDRIRIGVSEWRKEPFDSWWQRNRGRFLEGSAIPLAEPFSLPTPGAPSTCTDNTWNPLSYRPPALSGHIAVWTGAEMIVWGGTNVFVVAGRYDPATDSWHPIAIDGEPQARVSHTAVWSGTQMIVWGGWGFLSSSNVFNTGGRYDPTTDSWTPTSATGAPSARLSHSAVWTGSEMIVWGGCTTFGCDVDLNTGGRYSPATNTWTSTSTSAAPAPRALHTAVWTGSRMIVWGGCVDFACNATQTGGRYDPATDSWTATSIASAPEARHFHTAVWTGLEMIVWGGCTQSQGCFFPDGTGGRYNPSSDTWAPTTMTGAPPGRRYHVATWAPTIGKMIVWGGCIDAQCSNHLSTGSRYDPTADTWSAVSTTNAPSARSQATAVWSGSEMIVWGGCTSGECQINLNTGARYDAVANSWVPTAVADDPYRRLNHTAVWTGSEMIVWGGHQQDLGLVLSGRRYDPATDNWIATAVDGNVGARDGHTAVWSGTEMIVWGGREAGIGTTSSGGRYNPTTDSWTSTSLTGAAEVRAFHTAVWTGSTMIVWGGCAFESCTSFRNTGGRYDPATDTWAAMSTAGAPSARFLHTAVWSGSQMLVWGGFDSSSIFGDGARYDPVANSWSNISLTGAPSPRRAHTAVWSGSEMIVWGGFDNATAFNTGGRYHPATDTWTSTSTTSAPAGRWDHVAVWAGDEMVVWGGCIDLGCAAGDTNGLTSTGGRYDPTSNSWIATAQLRVPHARTNHTAVWTGQQMIVWGGWRGSSAEITSTGAAYCAGIANPQSDIYVYPTSIAFGNVAIGQSSDRTVTVWNTGTGNLIIGAVSSPSPPFSIFNDGCSSQTLPPAGTCAVTLRFTPSVEGAFVDTTNINSNDPDENPVVVALQGNGVAVNLVPASVHLSDASGNGIWEPAETTSIVTAWTNLGSGDAVAITGSASASPGVVVTDPTANYGMIPAGATRSCLEGGDCYDAIASGPRPARHWDAVISSTLSSGESHDWILHIGGSFDDVPATHPLYRFVETMLHHQITAGCNATSYCPTSANTRAQMAVFVLAAKEGAGYTPPACSAGSEMFGDVPASSPYCPWIEELARRGVVAGCGGGNYCPGQAVTRAQSSVFNLAALEGGAFTPPDCLSGSETFGDVPASSPFCRWVEEFARRGITAGCSTNPPLFCPASPVTRGQMSVFVSQTFGLGLYVP